MALDPRFSSTAINAFLNTLNTSIGSNGLLRFYSLTKPTNADTVLGAQVKLAELSLASVPFGAAASRIVVAGTITNDSSADAAGTATWATFTKADGTRILDVTAGTSGTDIIVNDAAFTLAATVATSSFSVTIAL